MRANGGECSLAPNVLVQFVLQIDERGVHIRVHLNVPNDGGDHKFAHIRSLMQ
jgi:hypothetical protein